jgi:hypothetical protein
LLKKEKEEPEKKKDAFKKEIRNVKVKKMECLAPQRKSSFIY